MRIVGVMMVKNEDIHIGQAIRNIKAGLDKLIVIDTGSEDRTLEIIEEETRGLLTEIHRGVDLLHTHSCVERFCNTDTWVFGVDGDEIYHPDIVPFLNDLRSGLYKDHYLIRGWYFHATEINGNTATGYFGPPSEYPTKLYNFKNISEWKDDHSRILFQVKNRTKVGGIKEIGAPWDLWPVKCLHMRFFKRSSIESDTTGKRLTGDDRTGHGSRKDRGGIDNYNLRLKYQRGELCTIKITEFIQEKNGGTP